MKAVRLLFTDAQLDFLFMAFAFFHQSNNPSIKKFTLLFSNNKHNFPIRLYVNIILFNVVPSLTFKSRGYVN